MRCPESPDQQCTLFGTNLFLIGAVASDSEFKRSVPVPVGFAQSTLSVPRPDGTLLYIKLRDDPSVSKSRVFTGFAGCSHERKNRST